MRAYYDPLTKEWYFKGRWYEEYPQDEIDYQDYMEEDRGDWLYHQRVDEVMQFSDLKKRALR